MGESALLKTDFIYLNRGYQCVGMAVMPLKRWSNPFAQTYLSFVQSTINAMSRLLTIESGFVTTKSGLYDLILPTGKGRKADAGSRQQEMLRQILARLSKPQPPCRTKRSRTSSQIRRSHLNARISTTSLQCTGSGKPSLPTTEKTFSLALIGGYRC